MKRYQLLFVFALIFINANNLFACEFCAIHNIIDNREREDGDLIAGIAYQYSFSDSPKKQLGFEALGRQELQSYITQVYAGYNFNKELSLQYNLPVIYREFRRFKNNHNESGSESGLGDLTMLLRYTPFQEFHSNSNYRLDFFTGLKLPTGNTDRLKEVRDDHSERINFRHGGADGNLIGGDDLTLGTGSLDYILGSSLYYQYSRYHLVGNAQYLFRTEGDYDYQFGNDFQWFLSQGYFLTLDHSHTLALRFRLSGETKEKDKLNGIKQNGSEEMNLFAGPELILTLGDNTTLQVLADFALENDDSEFEVVPKKRFIVSFNYLF